MMQRGPVKLHLVLGLLALLLLGPSVLGSQTGAFAGLAPDTVAVSDAEFSKYSTVFGVRLGKVNSGDLLSKHGDAKPVVETRPSSQRQPGDSRRVVSYCFSSMAQDFFVEFIKEPNDISFTVVTVSKVRPERHRTTCFATSTIKSEFPFPFWLSDEEKTLQKKVSIPVALRNPAFTTWAFSHGAESVVLQALHPAERVETIRLILVRPLPGKIRDDSKASRGRVGQRTSLRIIFGGKAEYYSGPIDNAELQKTLAKQEDRVRECYAFSLEHSPDEMGELDLEWMIDDQGRGSHFSAPDSTVTPRLSKCVIEAVRGLKFPAAQKGTSVKVVYPIVFAN